MIRRDRGGDQGASGRRRRKARPACPRSSSAPSRRRSRPARSSAPRSSRRATRDQADLLEQLGHERATLVAELKPNLDPSCSPISTRRCARCSSSSRRRSRRRDRAARDRRRDRSSPISTRPSRSRSCRPCRCRAGGGRAGPAYPEDSAGRLMQRELVAARVLDGHRPSTICAPSRPARRILRHLHRQPALRAGRLDPASKIVRRAACC